MRSVSNINWTSMEPVVGLQLHAPMVSDAPAPAAARMRQNLITREFATHSRGITEIGIFRARIHNIRSH